MAFVKGTRSSRGVGFDFAGGDGIVGIVMGWSGGVGIGAGSLPKTGLACPNADALMFVKGTRSSRGVGFDFAGADGIVMGWSRGGDDAAGAGGEQGR